MMNMFDGLYYSYYWMCEKAGYGKWGSHLAAIFVMVVISVPYIGVLWLILSWQQNTPLTISGREIPMYIGFFLVSVFLCIRFGWRKRFMYIISQHDRYDNKKYKRLRNIGIISFWIGGLIFFSLCFIKAQDNIANQ